MPVAAPADKRFRRAKVSPRRPRSPLRMTWKTLARVVVVGVAIAYGLYWVTDRVLSAEALNVSRITVRGNQRMSKGEVLAVLEGLRGANMMTADLESWRQKLLEAPWVADAAIRRVLPGTVAVAISERQPMGIGRIQDALYLVDQHGTIIDEFGPNYAEFDLPIIDGLSAGRRGGSTIVDDARAAIADRVLADLQRRPELGKRVSQIDVTDVHDVVVVLKGDTAFVRLGDDRFADRIQAYLDLAQTLRDRIPDIDYVDLRFDERVYVRPQGSARRRPQASGPGPQKSLKRKERR